MASITSTGLGSGLDVEGIVSKLVAIEKQPITNLQTKTDAIKTQISAYGKIQAAFSSMRDAAGKLSTPSTWSALTATSADPAMATVAAGSGSGAGSYSLSVSQLASSQSISSNAMAATDTVGAGTLSIELGMWNATQTGFLPKTGSPPVSVIISPTDTLTNVRDKINTAGAGVLASIVTDATGSRLVIRSQDTGDEAGFRVAASPTLNEAGIPSNLGDLAFDPSRGILAMNENVIAANAHLSINGLEISSATNTIENAVDGLSINVLKKGDTTVSVAQDKESIKKSINDFVTSYNALMTLLRDNTKYDDANKTAGALQGDSTAVGLQAQLRNITSSGSSLGGAYNRLSSLGLDVGTSGTITVDDSKLDSAMGHVSNLKQLFMGVDPLNSNNNGVATRWRGFVDQVTGLDGSITTRTKGLQGRVSENGKRTDELNDRAAAYEKRVRDQYTRLDGEMAKLNDLQRYVGKITSSGGNNSNG